MAVSTSFMRCMTTKTDVVRALIQLTVSVQSYVGDERVLYEFRGKLAVVAPRHQFPGISSLEVKIRADIPGLNSELPPEVA